MAKSKKEQLFEMLKPEVEACGYRCVDVDFEKVGRDWILTVYIHKKEGISLDDCEKVSRRLSDYLDETDPIEQSYLLEVSSPGLDRPFSTKEDYEDAVGMTADVKLFVPIDGCKAFTAVIDSVGDDGIVLQLEDDVLLPIPFDKIAKAAPHIEF